MDNVELYPESTEKLEFPYFKRIVNSGNLYLDVKVTELESLNSESVVRQQVKRGTVTAVE